MDTPYSDIIDRQRPVHGGDVFSRRHPPMARLNRAKLFAPFAALSGFGEAIRAGGIQYLPRRQLATEEARRLDRLLRALCRAAARRQYVTACVVYFVPRQGAGQEALGQYLAATGGVRGVDPVSRALQLGAQAIPLRDILAVVDPDGGQFAGILRRGHAEDGP